MVRWPLARRDAPTVRKREGPVVPPTGSRLPQSEIGRRWRRGAAAPHPHIPARADPRCAGEPTVAARGTSSSNAAPFLGGWEWRAGRPWKKDGGWGIAALSSALPRCELDGGRGGARGRRCGGGYGLDEGMQVVVWTSPRQRNHGDGAPARFNRVEYSTGIRSRDRGVGGCHGINEWSLKL